MYSKLKAAFVCLLLGSSTALAAPLNAKVIAYKDCHPDVQALDFSTKPQVCNMSMQALTFMIKGENIAAIDDKSLKVSKLMADGKDFRFNRKGDEGYKMGSFPKVDDNGKFAIIDINFTTLPYGKIHSISMDATFDVLTSERLETNALSSVNISSGFEKKAGPFTITVKKPEPAKAKSPGANKGFFGSAFGGNADYLQVIVNGTLDALVGIEVFENGNKLSSKGWSSFNNVRTLSFDKPKGSSIDIKVKYWVGLKRNTVHLRK